MDAFSLIILIVAGVIIADMIASPAGTSTLFSGVQKLIQIMINPTNNGNGF